MKSLILGLLCLGFLGMHSSTNSTEKLNQDCEFCESYPTFNECQSICATCDFDGDGPNSLGNFATCLCKLLEATNPTEFEETFGSHGKCMKAVKAQFGKK